MNKNFYKTKFGESYNNDSLELLFDKKFQKKYKGKIDLIITSPPFPLINKKKYGNEIEPIKLVHGGKVKTLQSPRYASHEKLIKAKTLDDIW